MLTIVYPDQHINATLYVYKRHHDRPDLPEEASVYLDVLPLPTPQERREIYLTEKLSDFAAKQCSWEFIHEVNSSEVN